jgi:plasmid stabilization system protein ParE
MNKKYILKYLPLFEHDLLKARNYILFVLKNPTAALKLVEDTEKAILKRLDNPLSFKPYHSIKDRKHPYYRIDVGNYSIFYIVIGDTMEVRRFIYSKRDLSRII